MKLNKICSIFILFLVIIPSLSCSGDKKIPLEQKLQNVLDEGIKKYDINGVSAAVIFPDGKLWTGTSGISHDTVTIKPDMLFAIGSITKKFVATLTLKLAEEGKLSLDDPLSKWLPEYPHVNSKITIRQLLNHTSGIYMFWSNQKIWDDLIKDRTKIWTPDEVLTYIKKPYFEPGDGWRYSNTNYLLLAMIITKATKSTLSSELRKQFWQPLHINSARLSIEEKIPDNQAHVFGDNFNDDGSYLDLTFLPRESHESISYGSAGVFMTAEDLALWCHSLFEGKILKQQSMDEMLEFVDIGFGRQKRGYGLGVQLFRKRTSSGEKAFGHSGASIGTGAYMVHFPKHHLSVVVMVNNFGRSTAITKKLIHTVLKEEGIIGIIPYFDFIPFGLLMVIVATILLVVILFRIRRRIKTKKDRNSMTQ